MCVCKCVCMCTCTCVRVCMCVCVTLLGGALFPSDFHHFRTIFCVTSLLSVDCWHWAFDIAELRDTHKFYSWG